LLDAGQHPFLVALEHLPPIVAVHQQADLEDTREDLLGAAIDKTSGQFGLDSLADLLGGDAPAASAAVYHLDHHVLLDRAAAHLRN
jgi:hypothetical protein